MSLPLSLFLYRTHASIKHPRVNEDSNILVTSRYRFLIVDIFYVSYMVSTSTIQYSARIKSVKYKDNKNNIKAESYKRDIKDITIIMANNIAIANVNHSQ